jgi:hypothetical protein
MYNLIIKRPYIFYRNYPHYKGDNLRPNPYSSEKRRKELDKKKKKEEKLQKKALRKDQVDGEPDEILDDETDTAESDE